MASSDKSTKIRNYLDGWVGSSNPSAKKAIGPMTKAARATTTTTTIAGSQLLLTGSSYLMPTLRIDRRDDSASLQVKIARALQESASSSHKSVAGVKSMLRGKSSRSGGRWKVPIVLDLSALVPDGSPHYVPPQRGLLLGVVETLGDYGISVVGLINTPQELETEAIQQLGLPSLLSKGTLNSRSTDFKVRLEDVVQMVFDKASSEATSDDTEVSLEGEPPIHTESAVVDTKASQAYSDPVETLNQLVETKVPDMTNSMVYYGSVRSGQQIAADKGQALVIIGSVNSGGEVLSDTDIFIFGKLRGRALAGLASEEARIVATSFDPELVCIGDTFTTVSNVTDFGLKVPGKAAMVSLSPSKELVVEAITL
jgi:septum site-determining protein MinC